MSTDIITTVGILVIARKINEAHAAATACATSALERAIEAGTLLAKVKDSLPHGAWLPWVEANCVFSVRTAQGYMRLAARPELKNATAAHLTLRAALATASDRSRPTIEADLLRTAYPSLTSAHVDAVMLIRDSAAFAGATRLFHEDLCASYIEDENGAVQFLAVIRPQDHPIAWIGPNEEILSACRRFADEIHEAPITDGPWRSVPSWRAAAFWHLSLAAYLELESHRLAIVVSDFLRALEGSRAFWAGWSCDARHPGRLHAGTDDEFTHLPFDREWWGHLSDMRHAGILDPTGNPRMDDEERARLICAALDEGMVLPSSMQKRGWRE